VRTKVFLLGKNAECVEKFARLPTDLQTLMMQIFDVLRAQQLLLQREFSEQWKSSDQKFQII
jgi:hypothetical protein